MVTAAPATGGGMITTSFTTSELAAKSIPKHYGASSKIRNATAIKHSLFPGYYSISMGKKGERMRPILLLTSGVTIQADDSELDIFVATTSNVASIGQLVIVPATEVTGSTIRLVTSEFAKELPSEFPKGAIFKSTNKKAKALKDLLPKVGESYVLIICPNTSPILGEAAHTVKGKMDDTMGDTFRSQGIHGLSWFKIMSALDDGVTPFDKSFQDAVLANKVELDNLYPAHKAINLVDSPALSFSAPPVDDDDDDDDLGLAISQLRSSLEECVRRNAPPAQAPTQPPQSINPDEMESLMGGGHGGVEQNQSNNQDRIEGKLRLLGASFNPKTNKVTLHDLKDTFRKSLNLSSKLRNESISNQLSTTSNKQATTKDAVNRFARWPLAYRFTPAVLVFLLHGIVSTDPIQDLRQVAKSTAVNFHTGHFLPQGAAEATLTLTLKNAAAIRQVQTALEEDPTRTNRINTQGVCTSVIKDWLTVYRGCANVTVLLLTLFTFDSTSDDYDTTPFLHVAARKIALFLSSPVCDHYRTKHSCNAQSNYCFFNILDRTICAFFGIFGCEESVTAAEPSNGSAFTDNIVEAHFIRAYSCLDKGLKKMENICAGAGVLDTPEIYANSAFVEMAAMTTTTPSHDAKKRVQDQNRDSDKKRTKETISPRKGGGAKNIGAIICLAKNHMINLPKEWPPGEKPLCTGKLRHNTNGCRNPETCTFNHDLPAQWSKPLMKLMKSIVKNDDKLNWNYDVASPELLGMQFSKDDQSNEVP